MSNNQHVTSIRAQHGFERTQCACDICSAPCKHIPGGLDPADLERLCPEGEDIFAWAEEHLRALVGTDYPTLAPARGVGGHCHWYFQGRCAVHQNAPYGCAFFDSHMPGDEVKRRYEKTIQARRDDARKDGLYHRIWLHLCRKNLIGQPGDRKALMDEARRLRLESRRQEN